jgi:hypothetical protein
MKFSILELFAGRIFLASHSLMENAVDQRKRGRRSALRSNYKITVQRVAIPNRLCSPVTRQYRAALLSKP